MATTTRGCGTFRDPPSDPNGSQEALDFSEPNWNRIVMGNRLYVGNLSFQATNDTLRDTFAQCGEVTDVHIVQDRDSGQSRGFAFVTMSTDAEAAAAIAKIDGTTIEGRALRVNEAEERQSRGGGGGGGGRSGGGGGRGGGGNRW
jgi:RNA recognition motif-containing protein